MASGAPPKRVGARADRFFPEGCPAGGSLAVMRMSGRGLTRLFRARRMIETTACVAGPFPRPAVFQLEGTSKARNIP